MWQNVSGAPCEKSDVQTIIKCDVEELFGAPDMLRYLQIFT